MKQYTERVLQAIFLIALFATIYVAGGEQYNTPGGHENTRETLLLCQNDQHEAIDMMTEVVDVLKTRAEAYNAKLQELWGVCLSHVEFMSG